MLLVDIYFQAVVIGRVRKIAVEKGRPSTSQVNTGRSPVTFCTGSSESVHSGVLPVKVVKLRGASAESDRWYTCVHLTGTRPAFSHRLICLHTTVFLLYICFIERGDPVCGLPSSYISIEKVPRTSGERSRTSG